MNDKSLLIKNIMILVDKYFEDKNSELISKLSESEDSVKYLRNVLLMHNIREDNNIVDIIIKGIDFNHEPLNEKLKKYILKQTTKRLNIFYEKCVIKDTTENIANKHFVSHSYIHSICRMMESRFKYAARECKSEMTQSDLIKNMSFDLDKAYEAFLLNLKERHLVYSNQ